MTKRALAMHTGILLAVCMAGAPASAQDVPAADTLLWPSWTISVAALGLGSEPAPLGAWPTPSLPCSRERRFTAGTVGFVAGLLADLRSNEIDWPAGFGYFPARSWRSLPELGWAFGKALVCPPPLTRTSVYPPPPARLDF